LERRVIVADEDLDFENEDYFNRARRIEADFEIGEDVSEEVKLIDLGRRAILALPKFISKIHEHDNTNLYKQFKDLIGKLYTEVHHVRPRVVILVDDEGNEIVLPKRNKYHLIFSVKDNVRGIIESVELKGQASNYYV
jgi:N utilization substance protein A